MTLRLHLRPLVGPHQTQPYLLLTTEPFRIEPWLEKQLHIGPDARKVIDHGWIVDESDGIRVRASAIASAVALCVHCTAQQACSWVFEHSSGLIGQPYAIPFTRDGRTGYHGDDDALLALGLRHTTLADRAKRMRAYVAQSVTQAAHNILTDPVIEQQVRDFYTRGLRDAEAFGRAYMQQAVAVNLRPPEVVRAEQLLGLQFPYTKQDVVQAHKQKIRTAHPDAGGSENLAKELNIARDLLLQHTPA